MVLEKISRDLQEIWTLVEEWQNTGICELEKDLVLDKLKTIYEQIKFAPVQKSEKEVAEMPLIDLEAVAEDTPQPEVAPSPTIPEMPKETKDDVSEPSERPEMSFRGRVDRKVILSLYDDDGHTESSEGLGPVSEVHVSEEVSGSQTGTKDEVEENLEKSDADIVDLGTVNAKPAENLNSPVEEPVATPASSSISTENIPGKPSVLEQHTTVLGEVINAGEETIGEVYAKQNHTADVASRIVANNGVSLRKSIGINDKFLLARDLFGGDMAAYERMISELETYTDLNDALIYIHDHYNWNPNSDGVKFLMELLTRKLS